MRVVRNLLALALVFAALPASAHAGSTIFVFGGGGGSRELHLVESNVKLTGAISVDFHGDPTAGCAAAHVCDVAGTARWNPTGAGTITALAYRQKRRRFEQGFLSVGDFSSLGRPLRTSARVRRDGTPGSLCADAGQGDSSSGGTERRGSAVEIRLVDLPSRESPATEILRTRCAGPMASDIAALLPARTVSERDLLRGHRTLDFSTDAPFAAHGVAGTLHSTVRIEVLHGRQIGADEGTGRVPKTPKRRKRAIEVSYRVDRVSGQIATGFSGRSDPDLCGPFDACGLSGSVTTAPAASSGEAYLSAIGPIRRTRKELRRAVGLAPGPAPARVSREGFAFWRRDLGSVTSDLTRGGAAACTDSVPLAGGGSVSLDFRGGRVRAAYAAGGFVSGFDTLRTRCPGPGADDARGTLASGSFPVSVFRRRSVTLRLTTGRRFGSTAYSATATPDVTIVLRRTGIRQYTFSEDIQPDFETGNVRSLR